MTMTTRTGTVTRDIWVNPGDVERTRFVLIDPDTNNPRDLAGATVTVVIDRGPGSAPISGALLALESPLQNGNLTLVLDSAFTTTNRGRVLRYRIRYVLGATNLTVLTGRILIDE